MPHIASLVFVEGRAGEAGTLRKGLEGPAEGFPLNSEYTGFQKGGAKSQEQW